eukprot:5046170-Pleurochrysis_carterae.AAC.1
MAQSRRCSLMIHPPDSPFQMEAVDARTQVHGCPRRYTGAHVGMRLAKASACISCSLVASARARACMRAIVRACTSACARVARTCVCECEIGGGERARAVGVRACAVGVRARAVG